MEPRSGDCVGSHLAIGLDCRVGKGELEMGFAGQTPHLTVTMFYAACPVEGLRTCLERQGRGREDTYAVKGLRIFKTEMYTRFTDTRVR